MRAALPLLVACLVALYAGKAWGEAGAPGTLTVTDTVAPPEYQRIAEGLRLENEGLRARLEGVETRAPERIVVTDTLIAPPDTVYRWLTVDSRGAVTFEVLSLGDSLYAPQINQRTDVSDCDDGWQVRDGTVVCDPARLGHLYVGPWLSRTPAVALWWQPSFRSPWEAFVRYSGTWDFGVRRGVRIW